MYVYIVIKFLLGDDHTLETSNITIKKGSTSTEISFTIRDDLQYEHDEIFHLEIAHIHSSLPYEVYGVEPQKTEIKILDDECKYQLVTAK